MGQTIVMDAQVPRDSGKNRDQNNQVQDIGKNQLSSKNGLTLYIETQKCKNQTSCTSGNGGR